MVCFNFAGAAKSRPIRLSASSAYLKHCSRADPETRPIRSIKNQFKSLHHASRGSQGHLLSTYSHRYQDCRRFPLHPPEIIEAGQHQPPVDVVEFLIKYTKLLALFAYERSIVGKINISLDEALVCTNQSGSWMLSCPLLSPNASGCAYVEDLQWLKRERDKRKLAI